MALPLRKIQLDPEALSEQTPITLPSRARIVSLRQGTRSLIATAMVALVVWAIVAYIHGYAQIASYEFRRQALQQKMAQLTRECNQLKLELDGLASQPSVMVAAQARGLELPDAMRLHYVPLSSDPLLASRPQPTPRAQHWFASSSRQLAARMDRAMARVSRGPITSAYAHE